MLDFIANNIWTIIIIVNYILAISAAFIILFKNINPSKTMTYIIVLLVFPFLGILVYYLFGQEYRKSKLFNRKDVLNKSVIKQINHELELSYFEKKEIDKALDEKLKLVKLLYTNESSPLTLQNKVEILKNGDDKFKSLIHDLKQATNHIHLEYYIFLDDVIGNEVIDILCEKAKNGVEVRVSIDDVGSKLSRSVKQKLKNSGVELFPFMPVFFSRFTGNLNYRNHRKLAIIDGLIGYIGGINIADNYLNNNHSETFWRDTHLKIQGEAVTQLQIHFFMTWNFVSNSSIKITKNYFPESKVTTKTPVQIAASGPDTDWANIMEVIFTAIMTANKYVYITTPYFIPNDEIISAMQVVSKSGVEVKLLIPKASDSWTAKHATNSYLQDLLEAGVQVYRYKKGFIHAKTIVVDGIFSSIGTSNMDYRSFNINFEINAFIYQESVSKTLVAQFQEDIKNSEEVSLNTWIKRNSFTKLKESFCRLFSPLL